MNDCKIPLRVTVALMVAAAILLGLAMSGCAGGGIVIGGSNIPWGVTTVKILNSTPYTLTVVQDMDTVVEALKPGQYYAARLRNPTGSSANISISVITHHNGEVLTSTRTFYVYSDSTYSDTWEVQEYDLR